MMDNPLDSTRKRQDIEAWDKSYAEVGGPMLWGPPVPEIAACIAAATAAVRPGRILEIPSGDGRNTLGFAEWPCVLVADSSRRALALLRERFHALSGPRPIPLQCDVTAIALRASVLDAVLCWDLLGHLREPTVAIAEMLRVLKPGGRLIATVFSVEDSTRGSDMAAIGPNEYIYRDTFYFHFYEREEAGRLFDSSTSTLDSLELVTWIEGPHPGYREYPHRHTSWCATMTKHAV